MHQTTLVNILKTTICSNIFYEYAYPIRGVNLGSKQGGKVLLVNLEYRLPMLMYYLPTIKWLGQINGVFFTDIGVTWNNHFPDFQDFQGFDISLRISNLLNERYEKPATYSQDGRQFNINLINKF